MARTNSSFCLGKEFKRMLINTSAESRSNLKKLFIDAQATAEEQAKRQPKVKFSDES